ncbi:hypothetical protein DL769_002991 [Monosporascus sp. CRB-8-3]|nr:hypothetical protein DL769_002991 [Monosporascus sp. CRB-8-3]
MRFSITALLSLVAGALAVPHQPAAIPRGITVREAGDVCGQNMVLNCCNEIDTSGDSTNVASGLLAGLLQGVLQDGELGLFNGCSDLSVTGLIGVSDLLNEQCTQNVACCQDNDIHQDGLVNVGLPCVAIGGIL